MRKVFFHKKVVEICTSIQEGLPLVPTKYMQVIFEGVLGAAAARFPVTICSYVVMPNHLHMLVVVEDPEQVSPFVGYIKTELAHAVNDLLGRNNRSVWVRGFFSPTILTADTVLDRLRYIYLNPADANLCTSIRSFPGLTSFEYAEANTDTPTFTKRVKKVSRPAIPVLPTKCLSVREQEELAMELREGRGVEHTLEINPWAWMECFNETRGKDPAKIQKQFLEDFDRAEANVVAEQKFLPPTPEKLRMQDIRQPHESKRDGVMMICLSSDAELRCAFIDWYKQQAKIAKEAIRRWRRGDYSVHPPPGFYLPGGSLLCCALFPAL